MIVFKWGKNGKNGEVIAGDTTPGKGPHQLHSPGDVVIDKETNSIIIADRISRRVMRWSRLHGTTEGEIIIPNIGCLGLAIGVHGNIYVSDKERHEVKRYSADHKNGAAVAG